MTPQDVANAKRDRMSKKRFAFPYGDTSLIAGTSQKEVKIKEYRYTGKEKDDATGLYYYGARYYASWLGRWMSCDPLFRENPSVYDRPKGTSAEEQQQQHEEYMQKLYGEGLNMYCYVKGNPVTFSDPSGHLSWGDVKEFLNIPIDPNKGNTVGQIIDYYKNKSNASAITSGSPDKSDNNSFAVLTQGSGGPISKMFQSKPFNFTKSNADELSKNTCMASSTYIALKMSDAPVGTEQEFFKKHFGKDISSKNAFLITGSAYIAEKYYGKKQITIEGKDAYEAIKNQDFKYGKARFIAPSGREHTVTINKDSSGNVRIFRDTGNPKNNGKLYDQVIDKSKFKYFQIIK